MAVVVVVAAVVVVVGVVVAAVVTELGVCNICLSQYFTFHPS